MVQCLCEDYGTPLIINNQDHVKIPILSKKRKFSGDLEYVKLYSFPTLDQLKEASEEDLRKRNFGYRSKYIVGIIISECFKYIVLAI